MGMRSCEAASRDHGWCLREVRWGELGLQFSARHGQLDERASFGFDLRNPTTGLNRAAAILLDDRHELTPTGDPQATEFYLGLFAMTQPAMTQATFGGFAMDNVRARTDAPLVGPTDVEVIVVTANAGRAPRRHVTLGRRALADCYEISLDRRETCSDVTL